MRPNGGAKAKPLEILLARFALAKAQRFGEPERRSGLILLADGVGPVRHDQVHQAAPGRVALFECDPRRAGGNHEQMPSVPMAAPASLRVRRCCLTSSPSRSSSGSPRSAAESRATASTASGRRIDRSWPVRAHRRSRCSGSALNTPRRRGWRHVDRSQLKSPAVVSHARWPSVQTINRRAAPPDRSHVSISSSIHRDRAARSDASRMKYLRCFEGLAESTSRGQGVTSSPSCRERHGSRDAGTTAWQSAGVPPGGMPPGVRRRRGCTRGTLCTRTLRGEPRSIGREPRGRSSRLARITA